MLQGGSSLLRGNFLGDCGARFPWGRSSGAWSLFTLGLPLIDARWRWCRFWRGGCRTLASWRRLGWQISRWRQLWVKVGGAGSVELGLDGSVDDGEVGGVEGGDGSDLGFLLR